MSFWAKRKAAVAAEAQAEDSLRAAEASALQEAAQAEKTDEELLAELGLPEPETLGPEGDFKAFLAEGVPQRLKSRALRCLWRSNPILANVDGLVDYGEDFTDASCVVENLQTAYQVGKGMLAHIEEMARQAELEKSGIANAPLSDTDTALGAAPHPEADQAETMSAATDAGPSAHSGAATVTPPSEQAYIETASKSEASYSAAPEDDDHALPPRRRMVFTFDETTA